MNTLEIVALTVGWAGFMFGALCGWRLWQWEKQLAGARIAVAYKNRVRLSAPLIDWLQWAKLLAKDQQATGRVVYRQSSTTVAILKPGKRQHGKTVTKTVKSNKVGA